MDKHRYDLATKHGIDAFLSEVKDLLAISKEEKADKKSEKKSEKVAGKEQKSDTLKDNTNKQTDKKAGKKQNSDEVDEADAVDEDEGDLLMTSPRPKASGTGVPKSKERTQGPEIDNGSITER